MKTTNSWGIIAVVATALLSDCSDSTSPKQPPPPPPTGTLITYEFCPDDTPIWAALQDGTGAWTDLSPASQRRYAFRVDSGRAGFAYVLVTDWGYEIDVLYAADTEFASEANFGLEQYGCGGKTVSGSVLNVPDGSYATAGIGYANTIVSGTDFTLEEVPDGPREVVATRAKANGDRVEKYILRRGVNISDGGSMAPLDFANDEAFEPVSANLTVSGLGTTVANVGSAFFGVQRTQTLNGFMARKVTNETIKYDAIPADKMLVNEVQLLYAGVSTAPEALETGIYFRTTDDLSLAFGPSLSEPTFSIVGSQPYLRPRAQLPVQAEYTGELDLYYVQDHATAFILETAGHASNWDVALPDLSNVTGFHAGWGLWSGASTTFDVTGNGGRLLFVNSTVPPEGSTYQWAERFGDLALGSASAQQRDLLMARKQARYRAHLPGAGSRR